MSLVLVPAAWRLGYRPHLAFGHPALLVALRLAGPVLVFTAATVGVQIAINLFGSRFGGVEKLYYAFVVFQLPYGAFVVAIATALVPELSERFTRGDPDGFRENLSFGLRITASSQSLSWASSTSAAASPAKTLRRSPLCSPPSGSAFSGTPSPSCLYAPSTPARTRGRPRY
jgi:peptidoglycan biosynthesis protein MviN/MurJ (putative lipid II flippase)